MNSQAQDARAEQAAEQRRRKRKERAAKSRTPDPKNIVSGAGQPLDPGLRRELEEQLGHDLGRVRLHTGRDAGQLTELLGADAVAVGQDVLFREGAFRPGTDEGRRLLAHELQHTVQNPHGLGTLRAGRELGAVSLPHQPVEREAEAAARAAVQEEPAAEVEEGRATPGWLRYTTVDADRMRAEAIDPATLVDRLANSLVRSLRGDPQDLSQRTRRQLAGMPAELLDGVLARLEDRMLAPEHDRVLDLVDEIEAYDDFAEDRVERDAHDAPQIEPDTAEEVRAEREDAHRRAADERADRERPASAPGPEKEHAERQGAPGSTPLNGGTHEERQRQRRTQAEAGVRRQPGSGVPSGGAVAEAPARGTGAAVPGARDQVPAPSGSGAAARQRAQETPAAGAATPGEAQTDSQTRTQAESEGQSQAARSQEADKGGGGQEQQGGGKEAAGEQGVPAPAAEESAARNRPGVAEQFVAGRQVSEEDKRGSQQPTGAPAPGRDVPLPTPVSSLEGVRGQDLDGPQEAADEEGAVSDSTSEVEVGGAEPSAWDVTLQPEDFLPAQDPDLSGVPTADQGPDAAAGASVPDLPAPPPTRADQVQAERDAEDAEDEAADADVVDATADTGAAEPSPAPVAVGGPGDTLLAGLAPQERAGGLPDSGAVSKDPKSGDDPKAGPVTAQTTVQQAPRPDGDRAAQEGAAKQEKGTPAAGERGRAAQEKGSQQAAGGTAAAPQDAGRQAAPREQQQPASSPAAGSERTADTAAPSAARDSQVTGGSNADRPGSATSGAQSGAAPEPDRSTPEPSTPAPAPASAPKAAVPTSAASASAASASRAPSAEDAVGAAPQPERAPATPRASASPAPSGGVASKPAGRGKGKKDTAPAPNLSQVSPEAGLSTAATLKPHKALEAMGGVGGAVDRSVGDEHKQLAAAPPAMQRPAGAPQTLQGKPKTDAPARYSQDPAQKSEAPRQENAQVTGAKEPQGPIEAEKAEEPSGWQTFKMALGFGIGWLAEKLGFKVDKQELAAKFAGLPTKDEALKQAQAGNAPGVQMQGAAQQTSDEQGGAVDAKGQETVDTARDDAGRSMGENQVYPDAPQEELKGKVPGADGAKGAAPGAATTGAVPPDAASAVAEHDKGAEFQAAFSQGQKGMSAGRQTKDKDFRDSQDKHRRQVDGEIDKNTRDQAGQRTKALDEVTAQRADWRKEQDQALKKLGDKKNDRTDKVRKDVQDREKKTDDDVTRQKTDSDKQIKDKGDQAETDAKSKADGAAQDSGNWLTKAFEWIKQKVIEIKNAIVRIIRDARDAVVGFIKNFKDTVERWINEARAFIVDTIKNLIEDLIAFAVEMVREIIELAARIRKFVTDLIAAAIAFVTRLAARLKQIVTDLLNQLAKMLSDILNILKKMLMDVVKSVIDAVRTVLDYASKLLGALGEFMMIAIDFLDDPGGWLSGAKNSAVDGAKHHLFREVQAAVKQWFQSKIEEIIGVPKAIIEKLIKGGFSLARIVKETWDAIVPQLPFIIGEIVITKVVAKLIPGAGWVMAVIDAIRTAIGALGAILQAMGAVLSWLRAVRQGGAGLLFAKAVAAGIVALLELAYQYLLSAIGKYVAKVGRRLKGIAAKLGRGGREGGGPGRRPAAGTEEGDAPRGTRPAEQAPTATRPKEAPSTRPKNDTDTPARPKPAEPSTARPANRPADTPSARPDTRPTPAAKPKPKPEPRPKPTRDETPARPKPDQDRTGPRGDQKPPTGKEPEPTRPKPTDQDTPNRPKDAQTDTTQPKSKPAQDTDRPRRPGDTKDETPKTPKNGRDDDPKRPKGGKDEDPKRPKDGKDDDPKRPKPDENDKPRKPKPEEQGPRRPRNRHDKPGPGRPKSKQDKKKKKQEEDQGGKKKSRLTDAVDRIRAILTRLLKPGLPRPVHQAVLAGLRRWYRLTSLERRQTGKASFEVWAKVNPEERVIEGFPDTLNDYLNTWDLPRPEITPTPQNGVAPGQDTNARYVNPEYARAFGRPPSGQFTYGFAYLENLYKHTSNPPQWDRMHLIPREVGGPAKTSNFVPARNDDNAAFYRTIEKYAAQAFGEKNEDEPPIPGWYRIQLTRYSGPSPASLPYPYGQYPRGFPETVQAEWGLYRRRGDGSSRSRSDWMKLPAEQSATKHFNPPPPTAARDLNPVNVNRDSEADVKRAFGRVTKLFMEAFMKLREEAPPGTQAFHDIADMRRKLSTFKSENGKSLYSLERTMAVVEERFKQGFFTFQ
ncbi:eCIS core domain-containing protein [Streptomyces sp. 7R007]